MGEGTRDDLEGVGRIEIHATVWRCRTESN